MNGALIGNYNVFSLCNKTMQRHLIYDLLKLWRKKEENKGIHYFDITFHQCRLNGCHKSISHANAHRDLRDAM